MQHLHTPFLDDIPTSDLVTLSGRQSIAGAVFARGLWAQEVKLRAGGTLGGVDLSRVVLLGQAAVLGEIVVLYLVLMNRFGQEKCTRKVLVICRQ